MSDDDPVPESEFKQLLGKSIDENKKLKPRVPAPPPEVSEALLPPLHVDLTRTGKSTKKNNEPRFDIAADETAARSFFMSLVSGTPYNMVAHPSLEGTITLSLKNVTVDEVMKTVHHVYGYEYRRTQTGYEVLPEKLRTKIFKVNYLNVKRTGSSSIKIAAGQGASSGDSASGGDSGGGSDMTTTSESDFWPGLQITLESMVGQEAGRKVVINPQTGIVIVRAMPSELRIVEEYLSATQDIIQRQVILEAKILEIRLNDKFQTGINWSQLGSVGNGQPALFGQIGGGSIINNGINPSLIEGNPGTLDPGNTAHPGNTDISAFGGIFSVAVNAKGFSAFIELMKGQGDVQVLSSPRISTINNQKAVIKVGQDEYFVTDAGSGSVTGAGGNVTTTSDVTLEPFFSGVALDVIPQIDENDMVTLYVHPSVSEVREVLKDVGQAERVGLATSSIRESDSIVRVQSGQVVVIGGLMQNLTEKYKTSVPGLGDIPVVGSVFGHKKDEVTMSELVILLRPIVVKGNRTWTKRLETKRRVTRKFTHNN